MVGEVNEAEAGHVEYSGEAGAARTDLMVAGWVVPFSIVCFYGFVHVSHT